MVTPTATQIRGWSKVEWATLGYDVATPDPLDELIARAEAWIGSVTGRAMADVPVALEPTMRRAVQLHVEVQAFESQNDFAETAADNVVASFSAGSYSEQHVDPIKRAQARMLSQNPALASSLWELMTDEKRDEWQYLLTGIQAPGFAVSEVDYPGWYGPYEPAPGIWGL